MKKILLGTTALAAIGLVSPAALAEAGLSVGINGYYTGEVVYSNSNNQQIGLAEEDDFQVKHEGEISVNGAVTLDNGITAGVEVNIEATNNIRGGGVGGANGWIDEAYAYIEGSFGRIQIGEEASAAFLMHYSAPYFVASHGVDSPNFGSANRQSARTATYITITGDTNKVSYFTPRFSGFQLGASYTPQSLAGDVGGQSSGNNLISGNGPFSVLTNGGPGTFEDTIEIGANYTGKVGDAEVGVSAGYATADNNGAGSDPDVFSLGANVTLGAFTIGGGYYQSDDLVALSVEEEAFSVAVQYVTGPWTVGAGYFQAEQEVPGTDPKYQTYEVGGSYALGKGVSVFGVVDIYRDDAGGGVDAEADTVAFGIDLAF